MLEFDAQRALQYAKSISRPRLVGSEGEKFVAKYLVDKFKSYGFEIAEQEFVFSTGWQIGQGVLFIALGLLLSVSYLTYKTSPLLASVLSVFTLLGALSSHLLIRKMLSLSVAASDRSPTRWVSRILFWLGTKLKSSNIIARFKLSEVEKAHNRPSLYLLAHYDSKSEAIGIPLVVRIILIVIAMLGAVVISLMFILFGLQQEIASSKWIGGIITALYFMTMASAVLLLLFRGTTNKSPGAIDNASGVGILLHLAEIISQQKETFKKLDVTFVATGAEEFGLMGAFAFCQAHEEELRQRKGNVYFLNFDGPGVDGGVYAISGIGLMPEFPQEGKNLQSMIKTIGQEHGLGVHTLPIVAGAMFDHFPFRMEGLDAVSLAVISTKSLTVVHSSKDTIEQLDLEGFDKIGRLACRVIERIAS